MSKITYLFGAGASCETMPLVNNLPARMKAIREILSKESNQLSKTETFGFSDNAHASKYDYQAEFIKDFEDLERNSSGHHTIDTYAKKLFATAQTEKLKLLKIILSCYLTLEQLNSNGKCDGRYDSFWASLIGTAYDDLPNNVRILTWNYDVQMELSFSEYCHDKKLRTSFKTLHVHVNDNVKNQLHAPNKFKVIKLNGTGNALLDAKTSAMYTHQFISNNYSEGITIQTIEMVIAYYSKLNYFSDSYEISPTLSFAWECLTEHKNDQTSFIKVIENEILDTEILVVIGYSFPFFNRQIDRALFKPMTKLRKVYIQDIAPKNVMSSFRSIRDDWGEDFYKKIEPIEIGNQFFLPPEL